MEDINKRFEIESEDGQKITLNLLFTYADEETNTVYAFAYEDGNEEDVMPFIVDEENSTLSPVEDEETFKMLEEILDAYYQEN